MCTLSNTSVIKVVLISYFLGQNTFAQNGSTRLQYDRQSAIQLNEISVPQSTKTISFETPTKIKSLGVSGGLSQITQDLTNRNLTFKNNTVIPLASLDSGERTSALFGVNYAFGKHSLILSSQQDVKPSLFTSKKLTLGYVLQMYQGATLLKFTFSNSEDNQPLSFYIDPGSLQTKERPTVVKNHIYSTALQQLWTERLKTQAAVAFKNSGLYRPDEFQFRVSSAYVLSALWTLKSEIAFASENKNQRLTYDRGYFESRWVDAEINYEWSLDSFFITGLSFLDEAENDPRRNITTVLGTDEIAIGIKQDFSEFNYNLKMAYTINSEKQSSTSFSGGAGWDF